MAKIMIIEDDRLVRELMENIVKSAGHSSHSLETGSGAIEAIRAFEPDLLLLDLMLPGMSGFEICRQVRRDEELFTLPILIVSAMHNEEEISHGIAQGADDYLTKPFQAQVLLQRMERLLRSHSARPEDDPLTGLPGSDAIKREIQRRVSRRACFALGCCELLGLREYARRHGPDGRDKIIRHLGRAIQKCAETLDESDFFMGHMGGGHFVFMAPQSEVDGLFRRVQATWNSHASKVAGAATPGQAIIPTILFCVTQTETDEFYTPQRLFDTLAQLRHKALDANAPGLYLDKRGNSNDLL